MHVIIGHELNSMHDPAIAVDHGGILFAEAIERHTQCKRAFNQLGLWYSGRPVRKVFQALGAPKFCASDTYTVRTSWRHHERLLSMASTLASLPPRGMIERTLPEVLPAMGLALPTAANAAEPFFQHSFIGSLIGDSYIWLVDRSTQLGRAPKHTWYRTDHHLCHAANAVYTSNFEECMVLVVDGMGDRASISAYHFAKGNFKELSATGQFMSLGTLYGYVTELCGFSSLEGEEWKVMGMAAYGTPRPEIVDFFRSRTHVDGLSVNLNAFRSYKWIRELEKLVGPFRRSDDSDVLKSADLAHNFQIYFEEIIVTLVKNLGKLGLSKNLAFAGGCALNSSANGKIIAKCNEFSSLHVPSAPGDDGNALGAVLYEKHAVRGEPRALSVMPPYLGSLIDRGEVERIVRSGGIPYEEYQDPQQLCSVVASLIADGAIIGWVQGRAEFGPRALGNRSILADPRSANMKDEINRRVKFREEYRPLAPAILEPFASDYFENYQPSPFMDRALVFRPEVRSRVPAVVHKDNTGRLQTVTRELNPLFYDLIESFYERTSIPILLNTSFNVMGKPIIHSIADAFAVFNTTDLDALVVGEYVFKKQQMGQNRWNNHGQTTQVR